MRDEPPLLPSPVPTGTTNSPRIPGMEEKMHHHRTALLITTASLVLVLAACSDDDKPGHDTGTTTTDGGAEAGGDAGAPDKEVADLKATPDKQPTADKAPTPDMPQLPVKDLKPFTLAAGYKVLYRFDDPTAKGAAAFNFSGAKVYTFEFGGSPSAGKVSVADLDPKTGKPGAPTTVISFSPTATNAMFAGGYLALSPKNHAAVGYTESKTYAGEIYWGDKGIKTPKKLSKAPSNFDVIFLDDKTLLVNGKGVGAASSGQGVYLYKEGKPARRLIKDLGTASGFMARGAKTVFAGGYFASGNKVYGFSLAEIKAAISGNKTLGSSDGDLIATGSIGDAAALGDDLVLAELDASWKFKSVSVVPVTVTGDKLAAGAAKAIITGGGKAGIGKLAGGGKRLGVTITSGSKKELAIIEKK